MHVWHNPFIGPGQPMCLYVVEIMTRGVKIGITSQPTRRIARHRQDAEAYGCQIGRVWMSELYRDARHHETLLKALGGPGQKREYLSLPYDKVVAVALALVDIASTDPPVSLVEEFINGLSLPSDKENIP